MARHTDSKFTSAPLTLALGVKTTITTLARAIKEEIHVLCSSEDTILRDIEAVKQFNWETLWAELQEQVPTLMTLFVELLGAPEQNKQLICLLTSMILKKKYPCAWTGTKSYQFDFIWKWDTQIGKLGAYLIHYNPFLLGLQMFAASNDMLLPIRNYKTSGYTM